ncbi:HD-GYP domain-containing protein [Candidatus Aalborgicola defluviihabitans]|uniref:HD-GYP domain-containing protein n=1 Tax=Candidatus Aalborgicola defluviihabitans TaxID=3386187 RepID=UPI001DB322B8|nr:HD domain-containing protein [Burkholderiales bacterium]
MASDRTAAPADLTDEGEISHAQQVLVLALATLAEQREADSESHILRVQNYVLTLAQTLAKQEQFAELLTPAYIDTLFLSVPLYDMGSIAIPDRILLKPGRLDADEIAIMRTHTTIGHAAIERAERTLGRPSPRLAIAKDLVLCHQEKWDGSGYPRALAGGDIPVAARIMAIADVYDALISSKVYKDGVPHDKAVQIIFSERGAHFDPDMVDAFIEIQDEFDGIAKRFADTDADMQHKIEYMANAIAEIAIL